MSGKDTARLTYANAGALQREIEGYPGYVCSKAFEGHALALRVQRSEPPYLKEPRVVTTRAEWLWLRDLVDEMRDRGTATQSPLPLKTPAPKAPSIPTQIARIAEARAKADSR